MSCDAIATSSQHGISRRAALGLAGTLWSGTRSTRASAQSTAPPILPLQAIGLEHLGMTVPDPKTAAESTDGFSIRSFFRKKIRPRAIT